MAPASIAGRVSESVSYVVSTSTLQRGAAAGQLGDRGDPAAARHPQVHQDHVGVEAGGELDRLDAVCRPRRAPRSRGTAANMPRSPSRTTGWSSTMSRVMVRSAMAHQRYASGDGRAAARLGLDVDGPRDPFGAGPHPAEAEAAGAVARRQRRVGSKPRPSSRTSRLTSSPMYERVTPTREARPRADGCWPGPPGRSAAGWPRPRRAAARRSR